MRRGRTEIAQSQMANSLPHAKRGILYLMEFLLDDCGMEIIGFRSKVHALCEVSSRHPQFVRLGFMCFILLIYSSS